MRVSNRTYLVPADADAASLEADPTARRVATGEDELTDELSRAHAGIVVVVFDACRNDPSSRSLERGVGGGERGLRPVPTEGVFNIYFYKN